MTLPLPDVIPTHPVRRRRMHHSIGDGLGHHMRCIVHGAQSGRLTRDEAVRQHEEGAKCPKCDEEVRHSIINRCIDNGKLP